MKVGGSVVFIGNIGAFKSRNFNVAKKFFVIIHSYSLSMNETNFASLLFIYDNSFWLLAVCVLFMSPSGYAANFLCKQIELSRRSARFELLFYANYYFCLP